MTRLLLRRPHFSLVVALLSFSGLTCSAIDYIRTPEFIADPAPHLALDAIKSLRVTDTLLVPTLNLRVAVQGSVFAAKGIGGSTASAKGSFVVLGHEKAALNALAAQLYADFVQKLKDAGWKVLTYDDIKDEPEVVQLARRSGDGPLALPTEKSQDGRTSFVVATPTEAQNFKAAMQGLHWTFRGVGQKRNATILIPHLDVFSPQLWGETRKGYSSASAKVNTHPGITLTFAMIVAQTPKGGGGMIVKTKYPVISAETVGTFIDAKDKSPSAANALSKGLSILGGGGSISRSSAAYQFEIDPKAYATGVQASSGTFLNQAAKAIAAGKP